MRHLKRWPVIAVAAAVVLSGLTVVATSALSGAAEEFDCQAALRYVAGGDSVVWGKDADSRESERFSRDLLDDHLNKDPDGQRWCELNSSQENTNTNQYVSEPDPTQQSVAWSFRPTLISLTLGRQNDGIKEHVTDCLQKIKDHDFPEANVCALAVIANTGAWDKLQKDLAEILNTYKVQMAGNPGLVVAVTGYFNPYPAALDVTTKIPTFCAETQDTIPTCLIRWAFLPPALITLDQVVKKLNTKIDEVVQRFHQSSQGRFVFVNPYDKFKDHCTEMNVTINTKVYHPTNTVHDHKAGEKNFGCSDTWIASDKNKGTKTPFLYLTPAVTGVLIYADQTTEDMGIHPNADGHDCIADLIWQATKNKLGVPQKPDEPEPCTGD